MGDQNWNTPPEIWERALRVMNVIMVQDPFPNETSTIPRWETPDGWDGFERPWDMGTVFVNGPWSKTKQVVEKCVQEWMDGNTIVAVVPTSLNSSYWEHVARAPAVCRPFRRVSFLRDGEPVRGNRQDCVIVYWGPDPWRFREAFRDYGEVRFG